MHEKVWVLKDWQAHVEQRLLKVKSHVRGFRDESLWVLISKSSKYILVDWLWTYQYPLFQILFLCVCGHLHQLVRKIQLILTKKWNYCWHWSGLSWHMGGKEGGPWGWWYTLGNTRIQAAWLGKALGMPGLRLLRLPRPISLEGLSQRWPTPTAKARRKSQGNLWLKLSGWKWQHEHAEKSNNALHLYL